MPINKLFNFCGVLKMIEKNLDKDWEEDETEETEEIYLPNPNPESPEETIRKTGLAWSAGISLFGSILVMLGIGWIVDAYFKSSPWGIVVGIILGAILGFYQFFKLSSQILKK